MRTKALLDLSFEKRSFDSYTKRELSVLVLKLAAAGFILASGLVAPNMLQVYAKLGILDDPRRRRKLVNKVAYLKRAGYVKKAGDRYVTTAHGKKLLTEDFVWEMRPKVPRKWDGKWHAVLYDIPAKRERARHALYARLMELGLERYQDSIFISKFSVRKEVEEFARFYKISEYIRFIRIDELE